MIIEESKIDIIKLMILKAKLWGLGITQQKTGNEFKEITNMYNNI